jgi:predicted component of type VI protein secretion system
MVESSEDTREDRPMPARLISQDDRPDIPLDRVLVVVGRHERCDVRVDSSRVSKRHCCLALDSVGVLVRDLDSTNGTWINGRRVADGVLNPGDVLAIAHLRYRLEMDAGAGTLAAGRRWPDPGPAQLDDGLLPETAQSEHLGIDPATLRRDEDD